MNDLGRCSVPISLCTLQGKRWMCHNVTVILEPLLPTHLFPFSQSPCSIYCHLLHFQHSRCCVTCNIFHLQYRHYLNHSCYHHWCSHQHPSLLITSHPVIPLCPHPHTPHAQVHLSLLLNSASLTEVQTNKTPWGNEATSGNGQSERSLTYWCEIDHYWEKRKRSDGVDWAVCCWLSEKRWQDKRWSVTQAMR